MAGDQGSGLFQEFVGRHIKPVPLEIGAVPDEDEPEFADQLGQGRPGGLPGVEESCRRGGVALPDCERRGSRRTLPIPDALLLLRRRRSN